MAAVAAGILSRSEVAALHTIRERPWATRVDVARSTGLSLAMAARVVTRLQDLALVREVGRSASIGRGRQASLLELRPDVAYVVGIGIGIDSILTLVSDLRGTVQTSQERPAEFLAGCSQDQIVQLLAGVVRDHVRAAGLDWDRLAAVGVAVTGIVDSENGECLVRSNTPGWENFPLAAELGAVLHRPVLIEDTARAKAYAELRQGTAGQNAHFLYVEAGASIGAGLVINRQVFRGVIGLAGELGHVTVDPDGPLCRCGNRGCVQASASARAVVERARELLGRGVYSSLAGRAAPISLSDIAAAALEGDKLAINLLTDAGEQLGKAIGIALNLLGLDLVVVGGALATCSPIFLETASRVVRQHVLPIVPRPRTVVVSRLGEEAAALGVAWQGIDWLFESPTERILAYAAK